jgi:sporulation protein YlmC with PRC-barrel domain
MRETFLTDLSLYTRTMRRDEKNENYGNTIGTIDKWWNSWNQEYPGYFFGIRPNENSRHMWFRGTNKLIPIYSDYIREVGERIILNKTTEELGRFWNKTIPCGHTTWPTDELVEKPVYDRNHSRVGTFCAWVETDGTFKNYGMFVDPFLCDIWNIQYNTVMPMPTNYITNVKDTINLDKTLDELKEYWKQHHKF